MVSQRLAPPPPPPPPPPPQEEEEEEEEEEQQQQQSSTVFSCRSDQGTAFLCLPRTHWLFWAPLRLSSQDGRHKLPLTM